MENIEKLKNKPLPCPLCNRNLPIKISKSGKPYIVCDFCGVQLFVRYDEGIQRLMDRVGGFAIF